MKTQEQQPTMKTGEKTALQKHVEFFDRDKDGRITLSESFQAWRALGFNLLTALMLTFFMNLSFAWLTSPSWLCPSIFTIHIANIHRCKHGSDTQVYDKEGKLLDEKLEEMFRKYDTDKDGKLGLMDIFWMTESTRAVFDPFGWLMEKLYWLLFWFIASNDQRMVTKEQIRGMYDGSLWYQLEEQNTKKKQAKQM